MIRVNIFGTGSDGNLSLIDDSITAIMIDCGLNPKIIKDVNIYNRLKACIITHEHKDHSKFADKIFQFLMVRLKVIAAQGIDKIESYFNSLWCD